MLIQAAINGARMTTVDLKPVSELSLQTERLLGRVYAQLGALVPDAELHHIGAAALPGAVTKGDVDVLVRVSSTRFPAVVEALRRHFTVKQPSNWTAEFASFADDTGHELPLGIQVVVKDSEGDFLLFLRDYLIENRSTLAEYNRLKMTHAHEGAEGYWQAKDAFFSKILATRSAPRREPPRPSWKVFDRIFIPDWLIADQNRLQASKYLDDKSKMELIFRCARQNKEERTGAPLAAGVFLADGSLLAIGVDGPGVGGHEMTNALILASNLIGSESLRALRGWEFFSLAPPCLVCQGNIYREKPSRFVYAVTHEDLLTTVDLPDTPFPKADWSQQLAGRGIQVEGPTDRLTGVEILRSAVE